MYRAPVGEIAFTLKHVTGLGADRDNGLFAELTDDLIDAILAEAGRFAAERIAPLNAIGDKTGSVLDGDRVRTPPGWAETYRDWCAAGWNGLTGPEAYGGQGLPVLLSAAVQEMWNSASTAFAIGPSLTVGAVEMLLRHGGDALRATYLDKLVSGEWPATMNLTEPQAGSDLGALTTRAERATDGTYRIFGRKIFITYGEHDMADNIVHAVLARLPGAPPGTKGISLFLVPKFIPDETGAPGTRNDLYCARLEEKLGIHASPTCEMIYGGGYSGSGTGEPGAVGWLIGEEHRGLACMFTLMNNARLMIGVQGVGIAEMALQRATAYANERRQGRALDAEPGASSPIIAHPDIRRTLLAMRGLTTAGRALCYACAHAIDRAAVSERGGDGDAAYWQARAGLLTPVAKAFSTDAGTEAASLGVQVHGGMGYIEETGAAQYYRDARIAPIYEGTNGIQAIDLVTRKLPVDDGRHVLGYVRDLMVVAEGARSSNRPELARIGDAAGAALSDLEAATRHLLDAMAGGRQAEALAGATPYLRLFGTAAAGALLARAALATEAGASPDGDLRIATARAFAMQFCPLTAGLREEVCDGADAVLAATPEILTAGA